MNTTGVSMNLTVTDRQRDHRGAFHKCSQGRGLVDTVERADLGFIWLCLSSAVWLEQTSQLTFQILVIFICLCQVHLGSSVLKDPNYAIPIKLERTKSSPRIT